VFESLASCFAFRCSAPLNSPQDESAVEDMTAEKSVVIARITAHCEFFCEFFYSLIDNVRLNFTLGIPQKFFRLKNSGRVLEDQYAFD
jgi:hypothetical protein